MNRKIMKGKTNKLLRKGFTLRDGYSVIPAKDIFDLPDELRHELGLKVPCGRCYMFEEDDTTYTCTSGTDCVTNADHVVVPDEYVVIIRMNQP